MRPSDDEPQTLHASLPLSASSRVLIAEDSLLVSLDLEMILNDFGFEIAGSSGDVSQALHLIETTNIDVAIIDYVLSDQTGEELTIALAARAIPFAICTGRGEEEIVAKFPDVPIVKKPFSADEVCRVLQNLVDVGKQKRAETR